MTIRLGALYDALIAAGVSHDLAAAAAEEVAELRRPPPVFPFWPTTRAVADRPARVPDDIHDTLRRIVGVVEDALRDTRAMKKPKGTDGGDA